MSKSSGSSSAIKSNIEIIFEEEQYKSSEEPSMSDWSSLEEQTRRDENKKKLLHKQYLYSPGSGEICAKYLGQSDSGLFRHVIYNYPAVQDPGIKKAVLAPIIPVQFSNDGQELYMALCKEMNICPVGLFYRGLLTSDINLSYYGVNPSGIRPMAMTLEYNRHVKKFNLTDNFLNNDACYFLGQMLNANVTLRELNVTGCRIGPTGLLRLGDCLHINRGLTTLNLARNNIEEEGGIIFSKMIWNGVTVKRLNLSKNNLGQKTARALGDDFLAKDQITHLDLSQNNLYHSPSTAKMLNSLAFCNITLQKLNLAWNALKGVQIAESIKNLLTIPTLTVLDLSNNNFSEAAIAIIVSSLRKAQKLVTLDLSSNPLSPSDARIALEKMLMPQVKLRNLLMTNVCVDKNFLMVLHTVKNMQSRKHFVVTYDSGILKNWTLHGPDARELVLKRADYLSNLNKKHQTDVAIFFLMLFKETPYVNTTDLRNRAIVQKVPLDKDLIMELSSVFPGQSLNKSEHIINLESLCEYMQRIWPDRMLPPAPPELSKSKTSQSQSQTQNLKPAHRAKRVTKKKT